MLRFSHWGGDSLFSVVQDPKVDGYLLVPFGGISRVHGRIQSKAALVSSAMVTNENYGASVCNESSLLLGGHRSPVDCIGVGRNTDRFCDSVWCVFGTHEMERTSDNCCHIVCISDEHCIRLCVCEWLLVHSASLGKPTRKQVVSSCLAWLFGAGLVHMLLYSRHARQNDQETATTTTRKYETWQFDPYYIRTLQNEIEDSTSSSSNMMEESPRQMEQQGEEDVDDVLGDAEMNKSCCRPKQVISFLKSSTAFLVNAFFLFLIVVNIGATIQNKTVQENLPLAFAELYPADYNNGTVCAWDNNGQNSIIQTFDTPELAVAANFSIVHCGKCGACSTYNDLRLQWTTRKYLAKEAQKCAKKSLFGGVDKVQECNEMDIGFSTECAVCWTVDELCARDNCVFIFFQQLFTNRFDSFAVGLNEITSATCDEAMCGREFGSCSGATRRRMDIVSSIARPVDQQCRVIDLDWAVVFDHE